MQSKAGTRNNSITISPTGRPVLPTRRSGRVARKNYAELENGDSSPAELGTQSPALGSNSRRRGAAIRSNKRPNSDADDEVYSSSGDEGDSSDDEEQLEEPLDDEQAADEVDRLAQLADAAMQDDQQRRRGRPKNKFSDARYC